MYELLTFPYTATVLGQLQEDSEPRYTVETGTSQMPNDALVDHRDVNLALEPDDLKGAWRSILACGKCP